MSDRPTTGELVAAVEGFLRTELVPALADQRLRFRALVAANALSIVLRELAADDGAERAEQVRLTVLLEQLGGRDWAVPTAPPRTLAALRWRLVEAVRAGAGDGGARRRALIEHLRWSVEQKLRLSNPGYLERFEAAAGQDETPPPARDHTQTV